MLNSLEEPSAYLRLRGVSLCYGETPFVEDFQCEQVSLTPEVFKTLL